MLHLVFLLLSVGAGLGIVFGTELSPFWLFALIPCGYVVATILFFVLLFISVPFLPKGKDGQKASGFCRVIIKLFCDWLMITMGVKVTLEGEKLPEEPFVLVSNHRSDFDPMSTLTKLGGRKPIFISKESNFKIPLVGPYIRGAGYYAIDRENGMRALRTLKKVTEKMKAENLDVGIYPEGTRSKTGELLEFKTGAFYVARKADAPVVVMTTEGTENIAKNFLKRRTKVRLNVVEILSREDVAKMSMEDLATHVRNKIAEALAK